ncbi:MAG: N-acetylmuramoyl-L-alanine amidase [Bacteroidetes bacterium]|nr:MAG: N-acetylmuramoyl-L-alanine amidase [Bacteroidota bacterium]
MKYFLILCLFFGLFETIFAQELPITPKLLSDKCSKPRGSQEITHLVLHFCSDAVENPANPHVVQRNVEIFETYQVSAHYLVGRDGQIYQLVKEDRMAFHAGKGKMPQAPFYENELNIRSIGIEIMAVGSENDMKMFMSAENYRKIDKKNIGFTEEQYQALNKLIADILKRNPKIVKDRKHIIGHEEFAPARRSDPGELFDWKKIGF